MGNTGKLFESFQNNLKESEGIKLTKDTRDMVEVGDILATNIDRYVIVNIINNPRSKAITVRDEKDWRPVFADPISHWYGTTIIKGPFIRKDGKIIKESEEPTEYVLTLEGKNKRQWSLTEAQFNEFQLMFEESELILH